MGAAAFGFGASLALAVATAQPAPARAEEPTTAAAGAHGGGGHAEVHREPAFSWLVWDEKGMEAVDPAHDYGPGLVFALVNFALLALLLYLMLGKTVRQGLAARHEKVKRALDEAERAIKDAEARHAEYATKIRDLDASVRQMRERVRDEAEQEARVILQRAQDRADRLAGEAERAIAAEVESSRKALEREVAAAAIAAAEALVKAGLAPEDKRRLEDEFLKQVSQDSAP